MSSGRGGIARGYAQAGFEATASWLALLMFAAAVSPMRNWPHYFMCVYPFVGLLIGAQGERLLHGHGSPAFRAAAQFVAAGILIAYFEQIATRRTHELEGTHYRGIPSSLTPEPLCGIIDAQSRPGDGVFIWGFDGDIYLTCRRRPATRFTYLTLVAGTVPPAWGDVREDRVAYRAREHLLEDLESDRTPVILDMPGSMGNVSMHSIPVLARFLDERYCTTTSASSRSGRQATVWVRRDLPACSKPQEPKP
jgi:hypothetical protein